MTLIKPVELGCIGHFICGDRCRWRRHTLIGGYAVSTVGDLYIDEKRETLGAGEDAYYETMVFPVSDTPAPNNEGCGCRVTDSWSELEGIRYGTPGKAQAGHEKMIKKYLAKARKEAKAQQASL